MKDEEYIRIRVSKKGKICLSLILCAICIAAVAAIIIPRQIALQNKASQNQEQTTNDNTEQTETPDNTPTYSYETLQNSNSSKVVALLCGLNDFYYTTFHKYLDTNNVIDSTKLNIDDLSFAQMEDYSNIMWQEYQTNFVDAGVEFNETNIQENTIFTT